MLAPDRPPNPLPLSTLRIPDPRDLLALIRDSLAVAADPLVTVEALAPKTSEDATRWVRYLPAFDAYRAEFPPQVVGLAVVLARRGMREHRVALTSDGRVSRAWPEGRPYQRPGPAAEFDIVVAGQAVRVRYVRDYFPLTRTDHFEFTTTGEPPVPLPFAPTAYQSRFAPGEQVEAVGGPEAFARRLGDAMAAGREAAFRETLEGTWPRPPARERKASKSKRRPPTPPADETPAPVAAPPPTPSPPPTERGRPSRTLFDDPEAGG